MEYKSITLEVKDLELNKREAVLAHSVYTNIDKVGDIATKGMFTKSWAEKKSVRFLLNHDSAIVAGSSIRLFEDDSKAYTHVAFGNWTAGNDALAMIDAGVISGVSFGYKAVKVAPVNIGGRMVRKLLEVKHLETSLLTVTPANDLASVVKYVKAEEDNVEQYPYIDEVKDMLQGITSDNISELKAHSVLIDKFIRNSSASDECIVRFENELKHIKEIITAFDTPTTQISEPVVSDYSLLLDRLNKTLKN